MLYMSPISSFFIPFICTLLVYGSASLAPQAAYAAPATAPAKTGKTVVKSLTVYAAGDIAECRKVPPDESMAARTAEIIMAGLASDPKALVLTLGDNTYPVGRPEEFNSCYEATWGQFKASTLPSPGNHDYGMPLALGYYNYFAERAGPGRRGYFSKTAGNWLLLSLNSNLSDMPMQAQLDWLRKQLNANKRKCILAFWHHPVFSTGGHGNNEIMVPVWKILTAARADLVLTSHDHNYERMAPMDANGERDDQHGIRSFVVGTGGARLTPMFFPKAATEIRDNVTHGVLKLQLHASSYDWKFLPVEGQNFSDTGHGQCH
jgi:hypothetical protein